MPRPGDDRSELQQAIDAWGGPAAFLAWWEQQDIEAREWLSFDWSFIARKKQLPPPGHWMTWHLRAGRGFGKTRTGAEWCRLKIERDGCRRGALIGATAADVRDVMVEGPSGLLAVCPPWNRPLYEPSKRRLTWPNGAQCAMYSAEEPDRLRGPQHEFGWADELAAWAQLDDTWDMLQFGMRMGNHPQCLITSTPRGLKFLRDIERDPTTTTTVGTTYENSANLAAPFLKRLQEKYEGTRLGRQEISADILDDNPGALWKQAWIDAKRLSLAEMAAMGDVVRTVVVALDPATTSGAASDEAGLVCVGAGMCRCKGKPEMHGFVFEDQTDVMSPNETCKRVLELYDRRMANKVIGETNQGGDWIESLLRSNPASAGMPYHGVHAKDGKRLRAEPVAALYEQGRVHHVGTQPKLEKEMTEWDPLTSAESPNRVDALVHGLTYLVVKPPPPSYSANSGQGYHPRR